MYKVCVALFKAYCFHAMMKRCAPKRLGFLEVVEGQMSRLLKR